MGSIDNHNSGIQCCSCQWIIVNGHANLIVINIFTFDPIKRQHIIFIVGFASPNFNFIQILSFCIKQLFVNKTIHKIDISLNLYGF